MHILLVGILAADHNIPLHKAHINGDNDLPFANHNSYFGVSCNLYITNNVPMVNIHKVIYYDTPPVLTVAKYHTEVIIFRDRSIHGCVQNITISHEFIYYKL